MNEISTLLHFYSERSSTSGAAVIATLIHVEGSSYRRPGARMIILEDGQWLGAISGGCLEGDVRTRALACLQSGQPLCVRYDTRNDEDNVFGFGLGCDGIIDVLLEPVLSVNDAALTRLNELSEPQSTVVHVVSFSSPVASQPAVRHWYVGADPNVDESTIPSEISPCIVHALKQDRSLSNVLCIDGLEHRVLIELIKPAVQLVVIGAGSDAVPLTSIARTLGWHVCVVDKSPGKAQKQRFPSAHRVQCLSVRESIDEVSGNSSNNGWSNSSSNSSSTISKTPRVVCVIMTHSIRYDAELLYELSQRGHSQPLYIGLLGSRSRMSKIRQLWNEDGRVVPSGFESSLHTPIGLDLGAETPEEIAMSICSEILAVLRNASKESLRDRQGQIHHSSLIPVGLKE